jgi:hypothetical protein
VANRDARHLRSARPFRRSLSGWLEDSKFEIRNLALSDDGLPTDEQGGRADETATGLEPA